MKINIDKIKERIASQSNKTKSKASPYIWKPTGKHIVRIVPYQHNPEDPFIQLTFHYGLNGVKSIFSPSSWGDSDPVVEFVDHLKTSGNKDLWLKGRNFERTIGPKLRTYVPVLVRGEEDKGVRFWGFGKTVKEQLEGFILNQDEYGDITDLVNGTDIIVDFKDAKSIGKDYPDTVVGLRKKESPVIDPKLPNAKELMELITNKQVNLLKDVFPRISYDEIDQHLKKHLENSNKPSISSVEKQEDKVVEDSVKEELPTSDESDNKSPSAEKALDANSKEIEEVFDEVFKDN